MIIAEEDYLEHFGVKGMKWGQRKSRTERVTGRIQKRIDRTERIAKGTASAKDRVLGSALTKKGANRQLQRWANNQAKLGQDGKYRISKALLRVQGVKFRDLKYGDKKGDAKAKMDGGQKAAVAALAVVGALNVASIAARR